MRPLQSLARRSGSAGLYPFAHDRQAPHLGDVVQDQRHPDDAVQEHEAARVDPQASRELMPKMMGRTKPPSAPTMPTMPVTTPMFCWKIVADIFECRRHAAGKGDAERKQQEREEQGRQSDVELCRTADGVHDEFGLRIGQKEQTDPRGPQHPPGHVMRTMAIREPATGGPQHARGKRKTQPPAARLAQC